MRIPWNKGKTKKETKECLVCGKLFLGYQDRKLCSYDCRTIFVTEKRKRDGFKATPEARKKMSESHLGKKLSEALKLKMSIARKGVPLLKKRGIKLSDEHKKKISEANRGEKSHRWIADRTKLKVQNRRNDSLYCRWRMEVYRRDNFKCRMNSPDCRGKITAHHILGWSMYPELRYKTKNGITLCHAHHPKKRAEEKRLETYFMYLVSVSKE